MTIFRRLFGGETKTTDISALTWSALLGANTSKAGVNVNIDSALRVAAVFACVRVLSEGVAQLPFKLIREDADETKTLAKDHPLYPILFRRPNDWQTSMEWRETLVTHAALTHGGFNFINRGVDGRVLELIPLLPQNVKVRQAADWTVTYEVSDREGQVGTFGHDRILHLRGPSWLSYDGLDVLQTARDALGLAIAQDESLSRLHSNGARPSGLLSTDTKLDPKVLDRIKQQWQDTYSGLRNASKTLVLDGGWKYSAMAISPADAQSVESRKHQLEEVARFFRVFPQMIGHADKTSTYASAEQFFIAHVIHSLGPWIERLEQAVSRDLLTDAEVRSGLYPKLMVAGLLRGDSAARSLYYKNGILDGWMTRNEARRLEDLNPLDGLDEPLQPLNMVPAGQAPPPAADAPPAK